MTVKLIEHTGECSHPDDPSMPYRLDLRMRPPSFMVVAFAAIHGGSEDVVARADSEQELTAWMQERGLTDHPRLSRWRITGPGDKVVAQHRWD